MASERSWSLRQRIRTALRIGRALLGRQSTYDGIAIYGNESFFASTVEALRLLQDGVPEAYALVKRHIGHILPSSRSGVFTSLLKLGPTVVEISSSYSSRSPAEYGGALAHEAYHCELTIERRSNPESLENEERQSLAYQCAVLQQLGVENEIIKAYEGQLSTRWWEAPIE